MSGEKPQEESSETKAVCANALVASGGGKVHPVPRVGTGEDRSENHSSYIAGAKSDFGSAITDAAQKPRPAPGAPLTDIHLRQPPSS